MGDHGEPGSTWRTNSRRDFPLANIGMKRDNSPCIRPGLPVGRRGALPSVRSRSHRATGRSGRWWVAAGLCVVSVLAVPDSTRGASPELRLLGEPRPVIARLVQLDPELTSEFTTAAGTRRVPMSRLIDWGELVDEVRGTSLVLTDGSLLAADLLSLDASTLTVESRVWPAASLPRDSVCGVLFLPPAERLERDRMLGALATERAASDQLRLANGDVITGNLVGPAGDGVADTALDVFGLDQLHIERSPGEAASAISVGNVVAILFRQPDAPRRVGDDPHLLVGLNDGSLLAVRRLQRSGADVALTLQCGVKLSCRAADLWRSITSLQPVGASARYLSDSEGLAFRHVPFLQLTRELGRDRNVLGGRLRGGGRTLAKGLGMHGTSRVVFELQPQEGSFAAELAIDDQAAQQGSVVFRVFLERPDASGGSAWEPAFQSSLVSHGDAPTPMQIDLGNAVRIALVTDFAVRADVGDVANWLNARVIARETTGDE